MCEQSSRKRFITCADVVALWATMSPAMLFVHDSSSSIKLVAVAYPLAAVYAVIRLCSAPLRTILCRTLQQDKLYWICAAFFVVCTVASVVNSNAPLVTMRHTCLLCGTIVIGLYFGCRYSITALMNVLLLALLSVSLASIFLCLINPDIAIMHSPPFHHLHQDRWRGVFTHKNWLGLYMGLLATVAIAHVLVQNIKPMNFIAITLALMASLFLLLKAQSTTALISLSLSVAVILCGLVCHRNQKAIRWRNRSLLLILPLLSACILGNSMSVNLSTPTDVEKPGFSRDSSLSGRVSHWVHVTEAITNKPWRGHGYETFWHTEDANIIHSKNQWIAHKAHSGWLDVMLDLGVAVGTMIILWMAWGLWRVAALAKRNIYFIAPTALTVYMFSSNSTESLLPNHSGLLFVLLIALYAITSRHKSESSI